MIKLYPLFSGSSGNSIYIEFPDNQGILVDAGRSAKQIEKALVDKNIAINNIKSIFITHEHTDHVSGVRVLATKHNIKIYGSCGTINILKKKGIINDKISYKELLGSETDLGFISVNTFPISHDCCEGVGYIFTTQSGKKIAVCTDLGYISEDVQNSLSGCDMVVLESNHDIMMLQNGPYPYYLKRRILSDSGHLSNESCGKILPFFVNKGTKNILLSHLSSHNNIPELAFQTALSYLENEGMRLNKDFCLSISPKENIKNEYFTI